MAWAAKVLCLAMIGALALNVAADSSNEVIPNEDACMAEGGLCVKEWDCPAGKLSPKRGLCPRQQRNGVECCFSVGLSETRCRQNGGECMKSNCGLRFDRASDCKRGESCCILVN